MCDVDVVHDSDCAVMLMIGIVTVMLIDDVIVGCVVHAMIDVGSYDVVNASDVVIDVC